MAVFTEVSAREAASLLDALGLGRLVALRGIEGGIENTNYFATTEQDGQERQWVLTLFERLTHAQLPFYLHLMKHLAAHGIPAPEPQAKPAGARMPAHEDALLHTLCGKPAAVVNRLQGRSELAPAPAHCAAVGDMLARMHLAGRDYPRQQPNLRGLPWWNDTAPLVLPHLEAAQAALLRSELAYQNHVAASSAYAALPRGPVHADLFRDNVMFAGSAEAPVLTGFFDFYFAGVDTWLFDLAVTLNDWAVDLPTGSADPARTQALLDAYQRVRPLTRAERELLPAMCRAGALRFWISRLWDWHLPREASLLKPHDPTHFERVLRQRVASPQHAPDLPPPLPSPLPPSSTPAAPAPVAVAVFGPAAPAAPSGAAPHTA
ncbi:homoserine kinase [Comamonadaceae bacterium OH2545_COT-014]|nr:homoserine kinase [Comamonadaceae bacterium OH2545_COT-014]